MAETDSFQPQVVTPGAQPQSGQSEQPSASTVPEQPAAVAPLDAGTAFNPETAQPIPTAAVVTEPDQATMADTGDEAPAPDFDTADQEPAITWTASEFIAHHKSPGWYGSLALVAAVLTGLVYLITRDVISSGVVIIAAILFGVAAARQPRQLEYQLNGRGVQIGARYYQFTGFRSFSVVPEGVFSSIIFMPMKRFAPLTTIYFDPKDEARIVDLLSDSLPFEDYKHDPIDQLMHRIRF